MRAFVLLLALSLSGGCQTDQTLVGAPAKVLSHISGGMDAITIGPDAVLYLGVAAAQDACLVAHEEAHKRQAKLVCRALVNIDAIYDDPETCSAAWIAIYTIDFLVHQSKNRFELGARAESATECGR